MRNVRALLLPSRTTLVLIKLLNLRPKEEDNIPFGRRDEAKIAAKHETLAKQMGVPVGSERPGIIDTGRHEVDNEFLALNQVIEQLTDQGFVVSDVHWEEINDKRRLGQKKPVTVIGLSAQGVPVDQSTLDWARRQITAYEFVHVWVNPQPIGTVTVTINAAHKQPIDRAPATLGLMVEKSTETATN